MKLLLDTHVLLWALDGSERVPAEVQRLLTAEENQLLVSAASLWEIAIKATAGRLPFKDPSALGMLGEWVRRLGAEVLPIAARHALETWKVRTWSHKDPFDRMLAMQAIIEGAPLVTADIELQKCPALLWIWQGSMTQTRCETG